MLVHIYHENILYAFLDVVVPWWQEKIVCSLPAGIKCGEKGS
jgi:hypothetical protein